MAINEAYELDYISDDSRPSSAAYVNTQYDDNPPPLPPSIHRARRSETVQTWQMPVGRVRPNTRYSQQVGNVQRNHVRANNRGNTRRNNAPTTQVRSLTDGAGYTGLDPATRQHRGTVESEHQEKANKQTSHTCKKPPWWGWVVIALVAGILVTGIVIAVFQGLNSAGKYTF